MSGASVRISAVVIGIKRPIRIRPTTAAALLLFILAVAGPAYAIDVAVENCKRDHRQCMSVQCDNIPCTYDDCAAWTKCMNTCFNTLNSCLDKAMGTGIRQMPTGTTQPPPKGISGLPPTNVGGVQPPISGGGSSPTKPIGGLRPINLGGVKQPGGGSSSPPKGITGLHPVIGGAKQPGTGTGGQTIYDKSGAARKNKSNVQELIKSWQQKVDDKNSVFYTGQTRRGAGSFGPNVKSQIFNQTNQTSTHTRSGKQKLQTEVQHQIKEKSNFQNSDSVSGSSSLPAASQHHGRHR